MDITQLILDDHHEQRRRFALLEQIDSAEVAALTHVWPGWRCSLKSTPQPKKRSSTRNS